MSRAAAIAIVLASGLGAPPVKNARIVEHLPPRPLVTPEATRAASWATSVPPVDVRMRNTGARDTIRLYAHDGSIDRAGAKAFMRVAASVKGADEPMPLRLVQLVFRASYHFNGAPVVIVSAMRRGAHGKHGKGEAIDFQLEGVRAATLASYLRGYPRAGVGIYTHPNTQYVHLDVRERSYHWIDASPPGVTWREKLLPDPKQATRDAAYVAAMDFPEAAAGIANATSR